MMDLAPHWDVLKAASAESAPIADLFATDDSRAETYSVEVDGLLLDYSKTTLTPTALEGFDALMGAVDLEAQREAMFRGAVMNVTEARAVLHSALRNLDGGPVMVDGEDVMPAVHAVLDRMGGFADEIRKGRYMPSGVPVTDVVNIGIGGSHLGPEMVARALSPFADGPRCHFVSNVDGADLADCLAHLDPATTLFLVASKTFTTQETMMNARSALAWATAGTNDPLRHFAAISTAIDATSAFGIAEDRVFGFADWVGGRYSLWGPIGLSIMLAIGPDRFSELLRGAQAMDQHFRTAPSPQNMPVMLALVGMWHHQVCGYGTRAVLPYEQRLAHLPAYLQQLEMESNGKSVCADGSTTTGVSGPVVWGEPGTNGQHAFYQLIHQGTAVVPCEFMIGVNGFEGDLSHHHDALVANCLAQSEALVKGRSLQEASDQLRAKGLDESEVSRLAPHRVFAGNRPSTTLVYDRLTPFVLGQIIALYEHRVFVEGVILRINSFDQWGVELGKELANALLPAVQGSDLPKGSTGSTAMLLKRLRGAGGDQGV